ncbi:MAG: isoprenylcysteine carboxylmethyltransferase family protein [Gemmatimonadales bacterium]
MNRDLLIYPIHGAFWTAFGIAGWLMTRRESRPPAVADAAPVAQTKATAPYSRSVLAIHFVAFGLMYFGLGSTIIPDRVVSWFPGQRLVGTSVIAVGAALMAWARIWFHSWRFRAELDAGHQLATGGPFRLLRHPIYMGLNLLALGSAVWDPTPITWLAVAIMVLGSDLRGRAEERLLTQTFGDTYTAYTQRTARFLPGIY